MASKKQWSALVPFARDWVAIATVPVWLPYFVFAFTSQNSGGYVPPILPSAALLAYTLAITVAYLDDLPVNRWTESGVAMERLLALLLRNVKWPLLLFTMTVITLLIVGDLMADKSLAPASLDNTLGISIILATSSLLMATLVVLFGREKKVKVARK